MKEIMLTDIMQYSLLFQYSINNIKFKFKYLTKNVYFILVGIYMYKVEPDLLLYDATSSSVL